MRSSAPTDTSVGQSMRANWSNLRITSRPGAFSSALTTVRARSCSPGTQSPTKLQQGALPPGSHDAAKRGDAHPGDCTPEGLSAGTRMNLTKLSEALCDHSHVRHVRFRTPVEECEDSGGEYSTKCVTLERRDV